MSRNHTWSEEEKQYVTEHYNINPLSEIAETLGRSKNSIRLFASRNGLAKERIYTPWSGEEIQQIQELAAQGRTYTETAKILGRSVSSVYAFAQANAISFIRKPRWAEDAEETLIQLYQKGLTYPEIGEILHRTDTQIYWAIKQLKKSGKLQAREPTRSRKQKSYHCWTEDEIKTLLHLHDSGMSFREIAEQFNVSKASITMQFSVLKKNGGRIMKNSPKCVSHWSAEDFQRLQELVAQGKNGYEIAEILGRSANSVWAHARAKGISLSKRHYWTENEIKTIVKMYYKVPTKEIAKQFNVSESSIVNLFHRAKAAESKEIKSTTHD